MKRYTILAITALMGIGILFFCLACTFFDPAMAAGKRFHIFWTDEQTTILHILSDKPEETQALPLNTPVDAIPACITVDPSIKKIYWSFSTPFDVTNYNVHIRRANFDGSDEEEIVYYSNLPFQASNIAIDPESQTLFYALGTEIFRTQAEGDAVIHTVYSDPGDMNTITDLALDPENEMIYFVQGLNEYKRRGMWVPVEDPTETIPIVDPYPLYRISLNDDNGRIYWTDLMEADIYSVSYEYGEDFQVVTTDCFRVLDLVSASKMENIYWADYGGDPPPVPRGIYRVEPGGSGVREAVITLSPDETITNLAIDVIP